MFGAPSQSTVGNAGATFNSVTPQAPAAGNTSAADLAAPPPSYGRLFERACREGVVSESFAREIKRRFSAPTEVKATTASTAATGSAQIVSSLMPQGLQTANAAYTLTRTNEAQKQDPAGSDLAENVQQFLQLLLMCDSGYNNAEAPPPENSASVFWVESSEEELSGLHAAVGAVTTSAASNLITFIKIRVTQYTQSVEGEPASASSLFGDSHRKRPSKDTLLHAAQCLYVLTRHFQMTASVVKEALDLLDVFYALLRISLRSQVVPLSSFSTSPDTAALNTLLWLCVFSVVNMTAVWKKLRSASGELQLNSLIQSSVASSIDNAVTRLRTQLRESVQPQTNASAVAGLNSNGGNYLIGGNSGGRLSGVVAIPAVYTWQVVSDSYLSILTLAEGCLLRAKGSEQGFDKAHEALLGERAMFSSGSAAAATPASVAVHRGKATKRMVQLAPAPRTLSIPADIIFLAPYEVMSYLFDEMLPLLHHLSEQEIATHRRYTEQMEDLPRMSAAVRRTEPGFQQRQAASYTHYHLGSRPAENDGEDGWLRRVTHFGLTGEILGEPFTSEMAHLLEALGVCLQHLPPDVLNPDLDSDCAATFFIFKNAVKHMRLVFATQRSGDGEGGGGNGISAVWENYTLKLMTRFLEVLAMIGRNPQYTQRVVILLTDAQTECGELQWGSLVAQMLECAGFSSAMIGSGGGHMSPSAMAVAATAAENTSAATARAAGEDADGQELYGPSTTLHGAHGRSRRLHRQFTRYYARQCQRNFIASAFLLMRQLFAHPTLRSVVSAHLNLEMALVFLFAPQQNQILLGSTLSLLSSLITNTSDAQLVWTFLAERHLLKQASVRTLPGSGDGAAAIYDRPGGLSDYYGAGQATQPAMAHEERLSLTGHCQYECTQGTYNITIGFLNLVSALFQYDQPSMSAHGVYVAVAKFIAQEVLRGVLKRTFAVEEDRYTVFALACAALRQALQVRFVGDGERATVLPFSGIMALSKAPADVVGEVVKLILDATDAPYELLSYHRAAVRQGLRLLTTAIEAAKEQNIELLLFDTRTTLSTDLAVRVLGLCSLQDTLMTKTTLQLLLLLPVETANQAAHYWSGLTAKYTNVLDGFTQLLHPLSTTPVLAQAPPELAQLDFETAELVPGWPEALLIDTKSLLMDLLMLHAEVPEPSLTAWMCGFYDEEYDTNERRARARGGVTQLGDSTGDTDYSPQRWWRTTLLTSVVDGACSATFEKAHPALAVKCVKLLYLLRANRLYGALVVRPFLEAVCQTLFLRLQHFRASQCTPVALSKYAYVLKLLAIEACQAYRETPEKLRVAHSTMIPSITVEVLLSLLHPIASGGDGDAMLSGDAAGVEDEARLASSGAGLEGGDFVAGSFMEGTDGGGSRGETAAGRELQQRGGSGQRVGRSYSEMLDEKERRRVRSGAVPIASRDAAVDMTSWLPQALRILPTFPEKLPHVTGGRSHLVPCAADGVVQYNLASLYDAVQYEQTCAGRPPLTMAELRERLRPFIAANDCFFSYAAGVSFVEGWCQLVSVSCAVVQCLSPSRLRSFARCILRGLDATTTLTAAAQEQVAVRLCYCLSTVMAHLRQSSLEAVRQIAFTPRVGAEGQWPGEANSRRGRASDGSAAAVGGSSSAGAVNRRRPREEASGGRSRGHKGGTGDNGTSPFATVAGDASNFYSAAGRSQLANALLQRHQAERALILVGAGGSDAGLLSADLIAANGGLLQPLIRALLEWGSRMSSIRTHLYISLLCLAETPGVNLDDVVLWRSQKNLLGIICADICNGCECKSSAVGGRSGLGQTLGAQSVGTMAPGSIADKGEGGISIQMQHAVALLVALLQSSTPIRDEFCGSDAGSGDEMGTWAVRCAKALLQSVDAAVCGFLSGSGAPLGTLLLHLRTSFDVLSVISLGHASRVLHSDLLQVCFSLQAWQYSTQVVLGYSQVSFTFDQVPNTSVAEQNREVLRRLLLGVVRWTNLLLSSLGDAAPLLYEIQKFIRNNRSLMDYVFISPAAASGSPRLSASHLTLCAELSDCLRALSSSVLAVDCRALVEGMALAELLNMLSSDEVTRRGPTKLYDFSDADGDDGGAGPAAMRGAFGVDGARRYDGAGARMEDGAFDSPSVALIASAAGSTASSAAERGRDVVALTVRNLAHLLLNAEYGLRGTVEEDGGACPRGDGAALMLRHTPHKRSLVLQIVLNVSRSLSETVGTSVREYRMECYLYALHALVCLLHSFALPLDICGGMEPAPLAFVRYLATLPLQDIVAALTQAHEALYRLKAFNTDYRSGMRANRLGAHAWAVSNEAGPAARPEPAPCTLSDGMRLSITDGEGRLLPVATPMSGPAGGSADGFSVPSTPGLLPNAETRRCGRESTPVQAVYSLSAGPRGPGSAGVMASVAGDCEGRDPNMTVAQSYSGGGASGRASPNGDVGAAEGRSSMLPVTEDGVKLAPGSTLWDLLPVQNSSGDEWTRLYNSYQDGLEAGSGAGGDYALASTAPLEWSDLLNLENEVRQVKIAIANALRATKGAIRMVHKLKE